MVVFCLRFELRVGRHTRSVVVSVVLLVVVVLDLESVVGMIRRKRGW